MLHRFVGCFIAGLMEGRVRQLVPHRLPKRGDVRDADRLGELVVKLRQDLLGHL